MEIAINTPCLVTHVNDYNVGFFFLFSLIAGACTRYFAFIITRLGVIPPFVLHYLACRTHLHQREHCLPGGLHYVRPASAEALISNGSRLHCSYCCHYCWRCYYRTKGLDLDLPHALEAGEQQRPYFLGRWNFGYLPIVCDKPCRFSRKHEHAKKYR